MVLTTVINDGAACDVDLVLTAIENGQMQHNILLSHAILVSLITTW